MFRITEDPSSGSIVQCLAKYYIILIVSTYILCISWVIRTNSEVCHPRCELKD